MEILFLLQSYKVVTIAKYEVTLYKVTIGGQKVEITRNHNFEMYKTLRKQASIKIFVENFSEICGHIFLRKYTVEIFHSKHDSQNMIQSNFTQGRPAHTDL